MRAYSMDLRERIFRDSDAGMTAVAVAEKYDVSRAWVDRSNLKRTTYSGSRGKGEPSGQSEPEAGLGSAPPARS
jgi:transposase